MDLAERHDLDRAPGARALEAWLDDPDAKEQTAKVQAAVEIAKDVTALVVEEW